MRAFRENDTLFQCLMIVSSRKTLAHISKKYLPKSLPEIISFLKIASKNTQDLKHWVVIISRDRTRKLNFAKK